MGGGDVNCKRVTKLLYSVNVAMIKLLNLSCAHESTQLASSYMHGQSAKAKYSNRRHKSQRTIDTGLNYTVTLPRRGRPYDRLQLSELSCAH
jgi:hypothetical protein